jgi:hypothetical protein
MQRPPLITSPALLPPIPEAGLGSYSPDPLTILKLTDDELFWSPRVIGKITPSQDRPLYIGED